MKPLLMSYSRSGEDKHGKCQAERSPPSIHSFASNHRLQPPGSRGCFRQDATVIRNKSVCFAAARAPHQCRRNRQSVITVKPGRILLDCRDLCKIRKCLGPAVLPQSTVGDLSSISPHKSVCFPFSIRTELMRLEFAVRCCSQNIYTDLTNS